MSGEERGEVDVALSAQRNGETSLPLMEVSDDCLSEVVGHKLGL